MKKHFGKVAKAAAGTTAVAAVMAAACPTMAYASGLSVILPNAGETIPMLAAFIILVIVLAKFGWPIFENMIARREDTIKNALAKSEEARIESERVLKEYREQLAQARQEAASIVAEAKQSAEGVRAEINAKAQAEADDIVAKARQSIEAEKRAAIVELQSSVADLTVAVATKVVGQDFSDEEHRQLIERSIAEAGNIDA